MSRIWKTFSSLTSIDSPSFEERKFCDALKARLDELGIKTYEDDAAEKIGGNCGNLYGFVSGNAALSALPPLLLSAHMDTVEPAKGKKATLNNDGTITSDGNTVLGADDVSGIVIILEALTRLKEEGKPHRPLELLFPVAEEVYGRGSFFADYNCITAKEAYILDLGGNIGEAANAAPTILSFEITVNGKAAHAGFQPAQGIHAISAAAKAIAQMPLGEPEKGVTLNVGKIQGGTANNIVPDRCTVTGEIRSLSHEKVMFWWDKISEMFTQAANAVGGSAQVAHRCEIMAYETPLDSLVVSRFKKACLKTGLIPDIHPTLGGSDQNNFARHGIQGLVIACSMHNVHSVDEFCRLDELEKCVELLMALITEEAI